MNNQVKLIEDLEKVIRHELSNFPRNETVVLGGSIAQLLDIAKRNTPPVPTIKPGDKVRHKGYGDGDVFASDGTYGWVSFYALDYNLRLPLNSLEVVE